jgi:hypothetical protein
MELSCLSFSRLGFNVLYTVPHIRWYRYTFLFT